MLVQLEDYKIYTHNRDDDGMARWCGKLKGLCLIASRNRTDRPLLSLMHICCRSVGWLVGWFVVSVFVSVSICVCRYRNRPPAGAAGEADHLSAVRPLGPREAVGAPPVPV